MIATLLRTAPAIGSPLPEWHAWIRTLTPDALDALSVATARALDGATDSTMARVRGFYATLPAPMVQVLMLRGVRDGGADAAAVGEVARLRTDGGRVRGQPAAGSRFRVGITPCGERTCKKSTRSC